MSHSRIQDPISASFNAFLTLWLKLSPFSSKFLAFLKNWAYFGPNMGFFGSKWAYFESKMACLGQNRLILIQKWAFLGQNGLILSQNGLFGSKMGLFWVVLKWMETLKPNPEIVELEIRSSNPLVMKHAREIRFTFDLIWSQMTFWLPGNSINDFGVKLRW